MAIASDKEWCETVQSYRKAVAKLQLRMVVSPRATFQGEKLLASGIKMKDVVDMVILRGATADQIKKIVAELKGAK